MWYCNPAMELNGSPENIWLPRMSKLKHIGDRAKKGNWLGRKQCQRWMQIP